MNYKFLFMICLNLVSLKITSDFTLECFVSIRLYQSKYKI